MNDRPIYLFALAASFMLLYSAAPAHAEDKVTIATTVNGLSKHTSERPGPGDWNEVNAGLGLEVQLETAESGNRVVVGGGYFKNSVDQDSWYALMGYEWELVSVHGARVLSGIGAMGMKYSNYNDEGEHVVEWGFAPIIPLLSLEYSIVGIHATFIPATLAGWKSDLFYAQGYIKIYQW